MELGDLRRRRCLRGVAHETHVRNQRCLEPLPSFQEPKLRAISKDYPFTDVWRLPNFQQLIHRFIHRSRGDVIRGCGMGQRLNSLTKLHAHTGFQQFRPRARDILVSATRAREYREGEARYLRLARSASVPDVRDRFVTIARHYRSLAKIEQSIADQRPNQNGASSV